jgi:tripartite-type tricarboxylate transporter receptor subunit TctC
MDMRRLVVLASAALSLVGTAVAQQWPTKPVHVVVNVGAGGIADRTARLLSVRLHESLGQPIVVENRPGGEGYIGFEAVARAEPDGHMLVFSPGSSMMISPHLVRRPDFDPTKTLTPIAPTGRVSLFLVTVTTIPARNLNEFIAYAKANAGKLNYGSAGNGTSPHIAAEVFKRETHIEMTHIPYKGAGPALKDMLGGQFQVMFDPGIALEHVKAGRLRMLAVAAEQRHPDFPDIPTFAELGYKGVDGGPHFGFYAPSRTPRAIVERLNQEVAKAMTEPENRKRLLATGLDIAPPMTPEQFAAYVRQESDRYSKLLPELGVRPE